jgi:two-component system KDP operon response regulator KdpE
MNANVLVIDDDTVATEQFARILRLEGFTVRTASNGSSALTVAATMHPDLILVDLRMPVLDGLGFLRGFQVTHGISRVPVALMTGDFLDPTEELVAMSMGARVVYKPIWADQLVALAKSLLLRSHGH